MLELTGREDKYNGKGKKGRSKKRRGECCGPATQHRYNIRKIEKICTIRERKKLIY